MGCRYAWQHAFLFLVPPLQQVDCFVLLGSNVLPSRATDHKGALGGTATSLATLMYSGLKCHDIWTLA